MAAVQQLVGIALRRVAELEKKVGVDLQQLWSNQSALKKGLDAAEFNLRAHQKLLNGLAADQTVIWETLAEAVDGFTDERTVQVISLPTGDGETLAPRVSWPYYHKLVEEDLKELAEEQAKKQKLKESSTKINKVRQDLKALIKAAEEAGNDPKEVEAEAIKLLEQTQRVSEEYGKMLRGEAFDESVIHEAQEVIDRDEARRANGNGEAAKEAEEGKKEGGEGVPASQEGSEHPEGAEVFGG